MKIKLIFSSGVIILLSLGILGCVSVPTGFLKPSEGYLQKRELQMRQYDTTDQTKIITSVAGVLQDLGFTLDDSEADVGFVAASKKADATNKGQIFLVALLGGLGNNPQAVQQCDKSQVIKASVITKASLDGKKLLSGLHFKELSGIWLIRSIE